MVVVEFTVVIVVGFAVVVVVAHSVVVVGGDFGDFWKCWTTDQFIHFTSVITLLQCYCSGQVSNNLNMLIYSFCLSAYHFGLWTG